LSAVKPTRTVHRRESAGRPAPTGCGPPKCRGGGQSNPSRKVSTLDFDDVRTRFDGWSFAQSFPTDRAIELLKWRSFASLAEEILKSEVHCAAWESFEGDRLRGCWRVAFEVRVNHVGICDAFYNAPAGYRAQFARSIEHGVASNRWLLAQLEPQLLQTCRERGIDTNPVKYSLQGDQAKVWIVEPKDDSHIKGAPAICCHQWSGPGQCAPIARRLEVKGAWLDSRCKVVADPAKEGRARQIHGTGFT
jgi:hypothetical protein